MKNPFFAALSDYTTSLLTLSGYRKSFASHVSFSYPFPILVHPFHGKLLSHLLRFLLAIPILLQLLLPPLHARCPSPTRCPSRHEAPHVIAGRELIVTTATHEVLSGAVMDGSNPEDPKDPRDLAEPATRN